MACQVPCPDLKRMSFLLLEPPWFTLSLLPTHTGGTGWGRQLEGAPGFPRLRVERQEASSQGWRWQQPQPLPVRDRSTSSPTGAASRGSPRQTCLGCGTGASVSESPLVPSVTVLNHSLKLGFRARLRTGPQTPEALLLSSEALFTQHHHVPHLLWRFLCYSVGLIPLRLLFLKW